MELPTPALKRISAALKDSVYAFTCSSKVLCLSDAEVILIYAWSIDCRNCILVVWATSSLFFKSIFASDTLLLAWKELNIGIRRFKLTEVKRLLFNCFP